jgi:ABC-type multidrug transport system fused ATPase/permease subunit
LIQKSIDLLMKWRTSIVIAHRLTTIQNADKIFMLENWQIIENWNYEELLAKKGKFFELANPDNLILK